MPLDDFDDDDEHKAISNEHILGIFPNISLFRISIN